MVSVIVPVYNGEACLRRCVDSITGQSCENLEILLVDDGSTDATAQICRSLAAEDPRIRVITQENRGVSAARNAGLDRASGEYILFVDGDDELLPNGISDLLAPMDACSAQMTIGRREGESPHCSRALLEGEDFLRAILEDRPIGYYVWRVLYRKEFLCSIRFAEGRITGEDSFFLFLCALQKPRVALTDSVVYRYHRNPVGATRSGMTEKKWGDILYFLEEKGRLLEEQFPHLMGRYPNLIVKTHMMLLGNFCRAKGWRQQERESLAQIVQNRDAYVALSKEEKRWFFLLTHHLYYPWKGLTLLRKGWNHGK